MCKGFLKRFIIAMQIFSRLITWTKSHWIANFIKLQTEYVFMDECWLSTCIYRLNFPPLKTIGMARRTLLVSRKNGVWWLKDPNIIYPVWMNLFISLRVNTNSVRETSGNYVSLRIFSGILNGFKSARVNSSPLRGCLCKLQINSSETSDDFGYSK